MKFLTYDEWIKRNLIEEEIEERECPDCDGSGDSECPECGQEIACETCKGSGVIDYALTMDYYKERKRQDLDLILAYTKRMREESRNQRSGSEKDD